MATLTTCSGDSYSSIEYDTNQPPPHDSNPFGNPAFPGLTYAGGRNWLGYLAEKRSDSSPIYIYDYAVCGHNVQRMKAQVTYEFMEFAGKKPDYCPWESDNSIFSVSSFDYKSYLTMRMAD